MNVSKISEALGLMNSMILSGESYTPTSYKVFKEAKAELAELATTMTADEYQEWALTLENTPPFVRLPSDAVHGMTDEHDAREKQVARLLHALIGLCTETGEAQDAIKKHLLYGKALDLTNVDEEMGDLLWYIALALDAAGKSMSDAMRANKRKLIARYGAKFTKEAALSRNLTAERAALEGVPQTLPEQKAGPHKPIKIPLPLTIQIEDGEDGQMVASVDQLKGCHTQGFSLPNLLNNLYETIMVSLPDEG